MCEANVYLEKEGKSTELMKNVITITPKGEKLHLVDLFGEQKVVQAEIKEIKLLEHKVILEEK